jgi:hypothetical protein
MLVPTVLRVRGFTFRIYTNDHEPVHVHAHLAGGRCRVDVATGEVSNVLGMKPPDAKEASRIVQAHRVLLTKNWEQIHA